MLRSALDVCTACAAALLEESEGQECDGLDQRVEERFLRALHGREPPATCARELGRSELVGFAGRLVVMHLIEMGSSGQAVPFFPELDLGSLQLDDRRHPLIALGDALAERFVPTLAELELMVVRASLPEGRGACEPRAEEELLRLLLIWPPACVQLHPLYRIEPLARLERKGVGQERRLLQASFEGSLDDGEDAAARIVSLLSLQSVITEVLADPRLAGLDEGDLVVPLVESSPLLQVGSLANRASLVHQLFRMALHRLAWRDSLHRWAERIDEQVVFPQTTIFGTEAFGNDPTGALTLALDTPHGWRTWHPVLFARHGTPWIQDYLSVFRRELWPLFTHSRPKVRLRFFGKGGVAAFVERIAHQIAEELLGSSN